MGPGELIERLEEILTPSLEDMGYELVRIHHSGGQRPVIQIMCERRDRAGMTVDDCADISRTVSALLDVADPIPGEYFLEVSSPGIDRPLTRRGDFERFAGFEAKVETKSLVSGRRRFRGRLLGLEGDDVRMAVEEDGRSATVALPFHEIRKAKLVLTDDLVAASLRDEAGGDGAASPAGGH
ncbi:MAG: ribosome maturation factor RimP [Alphaproteobacteria bacterium]|jgi:ribosome maturation factor RimP|nr:ribosome maturation factor RimP [Alphaproteobacteria bacterium]